MDTNIDLDRLMDEQLLRFLWGVLAEALAKRGLLAAVLLDTTLIDLACVGEEDTQVCQDAALAQSC